MTPRLVALVPAAGGGSRFGAGMPKQYATLAGAPVLAHTLARVQSALELSAIFVVLAPDDLWFERMTPRPAGVEVLRCGGDTRAQSVGNALGALGANCADDDWILVHDAARPCVPVDALKRLVEHLSRDEVGGLLAVPVADTLKRGDGDVDAPRVLATVARAGLWQAQTPQMFRYGLLRRALEAGAGEAFTDEASAVEAAGFAPRLVRGSLANLKITYAEDLVLAEAILAAQRREEGGA